MINNLGLQGKVRLPGSCKDVWQKLLPAKAFLLSSDAEGMSNALIEAMCLGLPVVSTKVSGSTDLIDNGVNGLLIDVGDKDGLLSAMCNIVEHKEIADSMSNNATKLYNNLNEKVISKQWVDYLSTFVN